MTTLLFELLLHTFNAIFHLMVGFAFSRCGGRKMNQRDECSIAGIISATGKEWMDVKEHHNLAMTCTVVTWPKNAAEKIPCLKIVASLSICGSTFLSMFSFDFSNNIVRCRVRIFFSQSSKRRGEMIWVIQGHPVVTKPSSLLLSWPSLKRHSQCCLSFVHFKTGPCFPQEEGWTRK